MDEIAENAVADLLTVNSTEKSDNWDENSEFFHNKDEYGISEFTGCKSLLYKTIGDSESGYKIWDILCFVPSLLIVIFLIYSWPRSRQKLSGAPFLFVAIHILLFVTSIVSVVRVILMWIAPSPNADKVASNMEKVTWSITHGTVMALELVSLVIFIFPTLPSNKASQRILAAISTFSFVFCCILITIEIKYPAKEFHVYHYDTNLFGDGGGITILLCSLFLAIPYSALISFRCMQSKSGARRSSTFSYCIVLLGVQGTRMLGGILLASDVEFGMCITNFTFYLLVEFLPPLVFMCVLCPYLQNSQGHGLLYQGYHTTEDDWLEDDSIGFNPRDDPLEIMRRDENALNDDDYEL